MRVNMSGAPVQTRRGHCAAMRAQRSGALTHQWRSVLRGVQQVHAFCECVHACQSRYAVPLLLLLPPLPSFPELQQQRYLLRVETLKKCTDLYSI